jgi:putative PIN family toxin of toxin-antitoxin system
VILDTNVLFSGLGRLEGNPARVVTDLVPSKLLVSPALLNEYRRVLGSSKGLAYLGITSEQLEQLVADIASNARIEPGGIGPTCPDPDDQHLWDLLAVGPEAVLVTGEHALLRSNHYPGRILSPRQFVERYLDG